MVHKQRHENVNGFGEKRPCDILIRIVYSMYMGLKQLSKVTRTYACLRSYVEY